MASPPYAVLSVSGTGGNQSVYLEAPSSSSGAVYTLAEFADLVRDAINADTANSATVNSTTLVEVVETPLP